MNEHDVSHSREAPRSFDTVFIVSHLFSEGKMNGSKGIPMRKILVLFLVIICHASAASSLNLINQTRTDHGFTIHFPFGWEQIPEKILKLYPSDTGFQYGFQERPSGLWFQKSPYILIEVNEKERLNEKNVKNTDTVTQDMEKEIENMIYQQNIQISHHAVEQVRYDHDRKILYARLSMTQMNAVTLRVLTAMLLTEKGYINVLCFLNEGNDPDFYSGLFDEVVDNIRLDEGMAFVPRFSDHFMAMEKWKKRFLGSPKNGLIILFICLGIWWSREKFFGKDR